MIWIAAAAFIVLIPLVVFLWLRTRRVPVVAPRYPERDRAALEALEKRLGHRFREPRHLLAAVTHASFANEAGGDVAHNETLEFLGDAVIELVTARLLVTHPSRMREGEMSKLRAMVVSKPSLSELGEALGLGEALRLSHGEGLSGGRFKTSLLANAYEAVVGAVFLDAGFDVANRLFGPVFERRIEAAMRGQSPAKDFKTRAQEVCQARFGLTPEYRIVGESGPDHAKLFTSELRIRGKVWGRGEGGSKKEAEQLAAKEALERLEVEEAP